ncbi:hypothetical protein SAMN05216389_105198 [Oceanobacillus limi]|uniref:Uncharacterized protein n=1 Tax=Oceanobacillus limi TaxID=930131 RepID=A0A1I0BWS9_9BACI|nr:hypothetical protein [Oceanobacillus limi]SET10947.1 hypothetical protein SAMN05216389_105198 [Oceanobacillus limi]
MEYIVYINSSTSEEGELSIKYTGEEQVPNTINYKVGAYSGEGRPLGDDNSPTSITRSTGCSGCSVTEENDEIDVEIEWNGNSETFTLTSE